MKKISKNSYKNYQNMKQIFVKIVNMNRKMGLLKNVTEFFQNNIRISVRIKRIKPNLNPPTSNSLLSRPI